jgi:hypothetical protein
MLTCTARMMLSWSSFEYVTYSGGGPLGHTLKSNSVNRNRLNALKLELICLKPMCVILPVSSSRLAISGQRTRQPRASRSGSLIYKRLDGGYEAVVCLRRISSQLNVYGER